MRQTAKQTTSAIHTFITGVNPEGELRITMSSPCDIFQPGELAAAPSTSTPAITGGVSQLLSESLVDSSIAYAPVRCGGTVNSQLTYEGPTLFMSQSKPASAFTKLTLLFYGLVVLK